MWKKIEMVIMSYDTAAATIMAITIGLFLPGCIRADFSASFYTVGITVLSIIFSLFFAAMAIIMASSDSAFIDYLEKDGHYTSLMWTFKFTLTMLFVSLAYSIVLFIYTDYFVKHYKPDLRASKPAFIAFVWLFSYSLVSTALSVKDTLVFSKFRTTFLSQQSKGISVAVSANSNTSSQMANAAQGTFPTTNTSNSGGSHTP